MLKELSFLFLIAVILFGLGFYSETLARQESLEDRVLQIFNLPRYIGVFNIRQILNLPGGREFIERKVRKYEFGKNWNKPIPLPDMNAKEIIAGAVIDAPLPIPVVGIMEVLTKIIRIGLGARKDLVDEYLGTRRIEGSEEKAWQGFLDRRLELIGMGTDPELMGKRVLSGRAAQGIDIDEITRNPNGAHSQAVRIYFDFVWQAIEFSKRNENWNIARDGILIMHRELLVIQEVERQRRLTNPTSWERTSDFLVDTGRAIGQGAWNWGARMLGNVQRINPFWAGVAPAPPNVEQRVEQELQTKLKAQQEIISTQSKEIKEMKESLDKLTKRVNVLNKESEGLVVAQRERAARERIKQEEEDKKEDIKKQDKDKRDTGDTPCLRNSININTASKQELEKLIEVGPGIAGKIIESRPFCSLDDLLKVSGIGTTTLQKIKSQGCTYLVPENIKECKERIEDKKEDRDVRDVRDTPCLRNSIDINSASRQDLIRITGIGSVRAARIIEMRQMKPFSFLDDLIRVRGIATTTLQRIKDQGCAFVRIVGGGGIIATPTPAVATPTPPSVPAVATPAPQIYLSYLAKNPVNKEIEVAFSVSNLKSATYDVKISILEISQQSEREKTLSEIYNQNINGWQSSFRYVTSTFSGTFFSGNFKLRISQDKQNFQGEAEIIAKIRESGKNAAFLEFKDKIKITKLKNQPPTAKFTFSPQNPEINQEITFDATSSTDPNGRITFFVWDFGDNTTTTTTSTTTTHRYSTSSNFTVTLTVVDNHNATSTTSTTVAIITSYPPTLAVVINEIAWMGTEAHYTDEWIELYNNTTSSIDLAGWRILKSGEDFITISTSTAVTTTIPAQGFFLLERTNHDTTSEPADLIYGNDGHKWALHNEGEILKLIDNQWNLVDKVDCIKNENQHCVGWFAGDREKRISMERISATTTGTTSTNWVSWASNNVIIRNGKDARGNDINGTPKSRNSVSIFPRIIYIFSGMGSITLPTKSRIQFSAEIWGVEQRINATPTWSVENTDVGSITSGGVFTASTTGETIITASLGAASDTIKVYVKESTGHTTGSNPPKKEWSWLFKRDFDNQAHSVQQTDDGGLIILGQTTLPGIGGRASWLIRTDAQGNKKWNRIFHPTDAARMRVDNWARSVQQTKDGGFIIAGKRMSSADLGWGLMWLIKTNSDGEKQWDKTFGSGRGSHKKAYSVQQTTDGGFILAGRKWWSGGSFLQLIKTSATGTHEWTYTHSGGSQQGIIGESARSVQQTLNGDFIVAGYTNRYNKELATDFLLLKISATGTYKWSHNFGGTGWDKAYSAQQTKDRGFIIAGVRDFMWGVHDIWLVKTSATGTKEWSRTFGGTRWDWARSVQQTRDGGFILTGYTDSFGAGGNDFWLIRTDAEGNKDKEWSHTFGGPGDDRAYSVQQISDREFIIVGSTTSFGERQRNIWLIKVALVAPSP